MEAKAELLTIAQLAVTLIGFSSLIAVFRARMTRHWVPRDFTAAAIVICAGGMGLLYSLFPFVLVYAGMTNSTIWAITSVVFSIGLFAGATIFLVVSRRLSQAGHPERMPRESAVRLRRPEPCYRGRSGPQFARETVLLLRLGRRRSPDGPIYVPRGRNPDLWSWLLAKREGNL